MKYKYHISILWRSHGNKATCFFPDGQIAQFCGWSSSHNWRFDSILLSKNIGIHCKSCMPCHDKVIGSITVQKVVTKEGTQLYSCSHSMDLATPTIVTIEYLCLHQVYHVQEAIWTEAILIYLHNKFIIVDGVDNIHIKFCGLVDPAVPPVDCPIQTFKMSKHTPGHNEHGVPVYWIAVPFALKLLIII